MDLRYFHDERVFKNKEPGNFPTADKVGLNCGYAYSMLKGSGYSIDQITEIEALRFLKLKGNFGSQKRGKKMSDRTLLVLTGFIDFEAKFQLRLLQEAADQNGLAGYEKIIIKSHPDLPLEKFLKTLNPSYRFTLTFQPLGDLLPIADTVFCSNSTTALLEAAYFGLPVIVMGSENHLNLNPLYGSSKVKFATDSKTLCEELKNPSELDFSEDYFYLDDKLALWRKLFQDQQEI